MLYQSNGREDSELYRDQILVMCDECIRTLVIVPMENEDEIKKLSKEDKILCWKCRLAQKVRALSVGAVR